MSTLEKALIIAAEAHSGQTRKNGSPYILHPLAIMARVESVEAKMVAVLHDVVEDTEVSQEDLAGEGFSEEVLEAVFLMTHTPELSYEDYIERLKGNDLAREVKLADMRNNINLLEIPELKDKDLERSRKYHKFIRYLEGYEREMGK